MLSEPQAFSSGDAFTGGHATRKSAHFSKLLRATPVLFDMSFHEAISHTLLFGQLLGLLPISGVSSNVIALRFEWKSFKFAHCVLVCAVSLLLIAFHSIWMFSQQKIELQNVVVFGVYLSSCITLALFFKLTLKWGKLMESWQRVEEEFLKLDTNKLRQQLNMRLFVVTSSSLSKSD